MKISCSPFLILFSGTGTSCVYPLIATKKNPTWTFTGVDVDKDILNFAQENVNHNQLGGRISLVYNEDSNQVYPQALLDELSLIKSDKFLICNPPFFSSLQDMNQRRASKAHLPFASGNEISFSEAVHCDGGELGFIKKLISGSEKLAQHYQIRLFSCLLGLKESYVEALAFLKSIPSCSHAYELIQIQHTCRWVLFWSFTDLLPSDHQSRLKVNSMKSGVQVVQSSLEKVEILRKLEHYGSVTTDGDNTFLLTVAENNWSRKARRNGPEPLPEPLFIEFSIFDNEIMFFFDTKSHELWECFIGFVCHLRKIK